MSRQVVLIGAGGYAHALVEMLRLLGTEVHGCCGLESATPPDYAVPVTYLGNDKTVLAMPRDEVVLVNAIGSVGPPLVRRQVFERFKHAGFEFLRIVHPRAIVASDVQLGEGVQVHANAVLQPGVCVGDDSIVNFNTGVDHDCWIGTHVHLAPAVVFSGNVRVDDCSHVGTGAIVIQGITIGAGATVGAGAVVVKPVAAGDVVVGVPARSRNA